MNSTLMRLVMSSASRVPLSQLPHAAAACSHCRPRALLPRCALERLISDWRRRAGSSVQQPRRSQQGPRSQPGRPIPPNYPIPTVRSGNG
eukprot:15412246-Heterocapsa_arctica.AAC.1